MNSDRMVLRIWDVEHGACAMLSPIIDGKIGKLAMVDSGCSPTWQPSRHVKKALGRDCIDYLFITNADQDHMSDLHRLEEHDVKAKVLFRNKSYTGDQIAEIKRKSGKLSPDAEWYVNACKTYIHPVSSPFSENMGGITASVFYNRYPDFVDTNELSLAVFFSYGEFTILFPGDLEKGGWAELLKNEKFRENLAKTNVLVASHHGRESGFCSDVFNYAQPDVVVISDKPIMHETQRTVPDYRRVVKQDGVYVRSTGRQRRVLTTRRDGWINFEVMKNGSYFIDTE